MDKEERKKIARIIRIKNFISNTKNITDRELSNLGYETNDIEQARSEIKEEKKQKKIKLELKSEFNFESIESNTKSLKDLSNIINSNFPSVWFETKVCASIFAVMSLRNLNGCPSLNLVGSPSGEKTTVLSFFYNHGLSYISDDFTPRAFVSHSANVKKDDLESVDLLPKLKNKVLLSPELAPLFEAQKDKLLDNFAILTRVLDGEGLNRDSGVHGHRGYSGDYKFGWIGATTPLRASVWNVMGKIGNRLFFLNMMEKNRTQKDYVDMFTSKAYEQKVKICRGAVKNFLDEHFKKYPLRSLDWDAEQDIFILQEIVKYAQLLAKLRGTLMIWKSEGEKYQHSFPLVEEPPRAINALFNLAKGHALIHGRTFLRSEDLEPVRAVTFSSMPHDRFQFLKLLIKHEGRLTTENIQKELNCSDDTARRTMEIFKVLGIVTLKNLDSGFGRPMHYVEIKPEFEDILKITQGLIDEEKSKPQETKGVYDNFSAEKFVNLEKKGNISDHTQGKNNEEYSKPQEINPVCIICGNKNVGYTRGLDQDQYCKSCYYALEGRK